ncbi:hypothetical protein BSKO_02985 [Bryopsis sp. KO-2023]|nr:hypothetical protein BSKO_02985 [Bryopsis sp. KO-2023]
MVASPILTMPVSVGAESMISLRSARSGVRNAIKGAIFDMDGTLTKSVIDFKKMRRSVGIMEGDILEAMHAASPQKRKEMDAAISEVEREALDKMEMMPGVLDVCKMLDGQNIPRGLITRNTTESVVHFHDKCFPLSPFTPALCRGFLPYKPHPGGILHICEQWNIRPDECIFIGDCPENDIVCGNRAGALTLLLDEENKYTEETLIGEQCPTFKVATMVEARSIFEDLFQ